MVFDTGQTLGPAAFSGLNPQPNAFCSLLAPLPVLGSLCSRGTPSLFWLLCLDALPGVRGHVLSWLG